MSLLRIVDIMLEYPSVSIVLPSTEKTHVIPYVLDYENSWQEFLIIAKQNFPWRLAATCRANWEGQDFWFGLDVTVRVPTLRSLCWIAFSYNLLGQPYWICMGKTKQEVVANMAWAISDTFSNAWTNDHVDSLMGRILRHP